MMSTECRVGCFLGLSRTYRIRNRIFRYSYRNDAVHNQENRADGVHCPASAPQRMGQSNSQSNSHSDQPGEPRRRCPLPSQRARHSAWARATARATATATAATSAASAVSTARRTCQMQDGLVNSRLERMCSLATYQSILSEAAVQLSAAPIYCGCHRVAKRLTATSSSGG